jgi:5'-3' exonuclease
VQIPSKEKKYTYTLLVDGDSLLKTAYHGAKDLYYKDTHIGGIFQFLTMLRKVINENRFDKVFIFWDGEFSGRLRYDIYKDYKANRDKDFYNSVEPKDPELYIQKERVIQYCEELFIRQFQDKIIEADDAIGYYCSNIGDDEKVVIISNDRDMCQLIDNRVGIYIINLRKIVNKDNYNNHFDHHHSNSKLIKILSGDASDNIKGIRGVKEKTLIKYFPEITKKTLTLEYIMSKIEILQNERKTRLKTLDNILNRVTVGCQGEDIFEINEKIIDLKNPLLTESSKNELNYLFDTSIDPEDRTTKNVIKMMLEDGLTMAIPGGRDGYINFLTPFLRIIKKEKNFFNISKSKTV